MFTDTRPSDLLPRDLGTLLPEEALVPEWPRQRYVSLESGF